MPLLKPGSKIVFGHPKELASSAPGAAAEGAAAALRLSAWLSVVGPLLVL